MKKILNLYKFIKQYRVSSFASSITFFFIINGGSLFFLLALTLNLFNIEFKDYVLDANQTLKTIILYFETNANLYYRPFYFILIITSLWSSSTLFSHIIETGELIYNKRRKVYPFFYRIISLFLVFIFIILLIIAFITSVLASYFLARFEGMFFKIIIQLSLYLIIPLFVISFFMLFVPPVRQKMAQIKKGLILTMLSFIFITIGFRLYLLIFSRYKAIYGAFTFIIIGMIYLYLLIYCLILGLLVNMLEFRKLETKKDNKL